MLLLYVGFCLRLITFAAFTVLFMVSKRRFLLSQRGWAWFECFHGSDGGFWASTMLFLDYRWLGDLRAYFFLNRSTYLIFLTCCYYWCPGCQYSTPGKFQNLTHRRPSTRSYQILPPCWSTCISMHLSTQHFACSWHYQIVYAPCFEHYVALLHVFRYLTGSVLLNQLLSLAMCL